MKFKNKGKGVQVRLKEKSGYRWELVWPGEIIDLPEEIGLRHGFKKVSDLPDSKSKPKVTEGKIGSKKVETKQIEKRKDKTVDFYNELIKINGIGFQTAEDIIVIFSKKSLIKAISNKEKLPFRDDIEKKLRRKYGRR